MLRDPASYKTINAASHLGERHSTDLRTDIPRSSNRHLTGPGTDIPRNLDRHFTAPISRRQIPRWPVRGAQPHALPGRTSRQPRDWYPARRHLRQIRPSNAPLSIPAPKHLISSAAKTRTGPSKSSLSRRVTTGTPSILRVLRRQCHNRELNTVASAVRGVTPFSIARDGHGHAPAHDDHRIAPFVPASEENSHSSYGLIRAPGLSVFIQAGSAERGAYSGSYGDRSRLPGWSDVELAELRSTHEGMEDAPTQDQRLNVRLLGVSDCVTIATQL